MVSSSGEELFLIDYNFADLAVLSEVFLSGEGLFVGHRLSEPDEINEVLFDDSRVLRQ